jgi:hypothetical protein
MAKVLYIYINIIGNCFVEYSSIHCINASVLYVGLNWVLTSEAAEYDELFSGGVIRIDDEVGILFNYLDSSLDVYPRSSTHYSERLDECLFKNPGM